MKSTKILKALAHRISQCADTLDWQAIAHVQYLNRASEQKLAKLYAKVDEGAASEKKKKSTSFHRAMKSVGAAAIQIVCDRAADVRIAQLDQTFLTLAPWTDKEHFPENSASGNATVVLVVDMVVPDTQNVLTTEGHDVKHWCRFSMREQLHEVRRC